MSDSIKKGWLPMRLPNDIKELTMLLETERTLGDRKNVKVMEKYLEHLKKQDK